MKSEKPTGAEAIESLKAKHGLGPPPAAKIPKDYICDSKYFLETALHLGIECNLEDEHKDMWEYYLFPLVGEYLHMHHTSTAQAPWQVHEDADGNMYFSNWKENTKTYADPREKYFRSLVGEQRRLQRTKFSKFSNVSENSSIFKGGYLDTWYVFADEEGESSVYYLNLKTGKRLQYCPNIGFNLTLIFQKCCRRFLARKIKERKEKKALEDQIAAELALEEKRIEDEKKAKIERERREKVRAEKEAKAKEQERLAKLKKEEEDRIAAERRAELIKTSKVAEMEYLKEKGGAAALAAKLKDDIESNEEVDIALQIQKARAREMEEAHVHDLLKAEEARIRLEEEMEEERERESRINLRREELKQRELGDSFFGLDIVMRYYKRERERRQMKMEDESVYLGRKVKEQMRQEQALALMRQVEAVKMEAEKKREQMRNEEMSEAEWLQRRYGDRFWGLDKHVINEIEKFKSEQLRQEKITEKRLTELRARWKQIGIERKIQKQHREKRLEEKRRKKYMEKFWSATTSSLTVKHNWNSSRPLNGDTISKEFPMSCVYAPRAAMIARIFHPQNVHSTYGKRSRGMVFMEPEFECSLPNLQKRSKTTMKLQLKMSRGRRPNTSKGRIRGTESHNRFRAKFRKYANSGRGRGRGRGRGGNNDLWLTITGAGGRNGKKSNLNGVGMLKVPQFKPYQGRSRSMRPTTAPSF
eukprot:g1386.t1